MASSVIRVLKKCMSHLFIDSMDVEAELGSSDWTKALSVLQNSAISVRSKPLTSHYSCGNIVNECLDKGSSSTPTIVNLAACRGLLNFLCMVMDTSLSFKSLPRTVTYLINFER